MTEEILDHYVTDTDVERMADDLAIDEMHNLNFGDLQFVLKRLLREKYRSVHITRPLLQLFGGS